jgi:hypothetical protein
MKKRINFLFHFWPVSTFGPSFGSLVLHHRLLFSTPSPPLVFSGRGPVRPKPKPAPSPGPIAGPLEPIRGPGTPVSMADTASCRRRSWACTPGTSRRPRLFKVARLSSCAPSPALPPPVAPRLARAASHATMPSAMVGSSPIHRLGRSRIKSTPPDAS